MKAELVYHDKVVELPDSIVEIKNINKLFEDFYNDLRRLKK